MPHLRNFCNILSRIDLLDRQLTILKYSSQKKQKVRAHLPPFSREPNRGFGTNTLRRSSVSAAIRPLLGSPIRISLLSKALLSSTRPFTTATWDWETQHQMVRFTEMCEEEKTGREGIGAGSIQTDMVAHCPESLSVREWKRSQKNAAALQLGNKSRSFRYMLCCVARIPLSVVILVQLTVPTVPSHFNNSIWSLEGSHVIQRHCHIFYLRKGNNFSKLYYLILTIH